MPVVPGYQVEGIVAHLALADVMHDDDGDAQLARESLQWGHGIVIGIVCGFLKLLWRLP